MFLSLSRKGGGGGGGGGSYTASTYLSITAQLGQCCMGKMSLVNRLLVKMNKAQSFMSCRIEEKTSRQRQLCPVLYISQH